MTFDPTWTRSAAKDLRTALRSRKAVLVHDSALYGTYFDAISSQLGSSITVRADALCGTEFQDLDAEWDEYSVLIVRGVELLKDTRAGTLGQLRAKVHKAVERGLDVCLVSSVSRESFPSEPGSAILFEVPRYVLQPCIPKASDSYGLTRLPAIYEDSARDFRALFTSALKEVSVSALVELDRALFELGQEADFALELPVLVQEELRHAGFLVRGGDGSELEFCVPARFSNFKLAVADAISWLATPPPWAADTFEGLFEIERIMRRKVRDAAGGLEGERWKKGLLSEGKAAEVLAHAHSDGQFWVPTVEAMRDPLEWLTLGDLLDLIRSKFANLECSARLWTQFASEVVPVRNRIGHMRLTTLEDQRVVHKWRSMLQRML